MARDGSKQISADDSLAEDKLRSSREPVSLAQQIWQSMDNESVLLPPAKASPMKAEIQIPQLNLSALGLQAVNAQSCRIFSGENQATISFDQLKHPSLDGSHYALVGTTHGSFELHWGARQDQRYLLGQRGDKSWFGNYFSAEQDGRIYSDYHLKLSN